MSYSEQETVIGRAVVFVRDLVTGPHSRRPSMVGSEGSGRARPPGLRWPPNPVQRPGRGRILPKLLVLALALWVPLSANGQAKSVEELIGELGSGEIGVRVNAARMLGEYGADAKEAVPALIQCLDANELVVRTHAVKALRRIGEASRPAIPKLAQSLLDDDYEYSVFVGDTLLTLVGPDTPEAVGELEKVLEVDNSQAREAAERALAKIGTEEALRAVRLSKQDAASKQVVALVAGLGSPKSNERRDAAQALGDLGASAVEAAPKLIETLRDRDEGVRMWAEWALEQMGKAAEPELMKVFSGKDVVLQRRVLRLLERINPAEVKKIREAQPLKFRVQ